MVRISSKKDAVVVLAENCRLPGCDSDPLPWTQRQIPTQQLSKIGLDARDLLDRRTGIWEN